MKEKFQTTDTALFRIHKDGENLLQKLYQKVAAYFSDDDSDELTVDPLFTLLLNKDYLASQPTLSRFFNRMDENTITQIQEINSILRDRIYSVSRPQHVLFDVDSTNFKTYGEQEESGYNAHYASNGYHPLLVYDGLIGDLLKFQLRKGTIYTSKNVASFMEPLLQEYQLKSRCGPIFKRGQWICGS